MQEFVRGPAKVRRFRDRTPASVRHELERPAQLDHVGAFIVSEVLIRYSVARNYEEIAVRLHVKPDFFAAVCDGGAAELDRPSSDSYNQCVVLGTVIRINVSGICNAGFVDLSVIAFRQLLLPIGNCLLDLLLRVCLLHRYFL